ncbi:DUF6783 domain-containing protein [Ruminococcus sp. RTP21484sp1_RTP31023st1_H8_RTP31023_210422]|uniref:DUF6783 domain-containing protein n=1 Tax=Ruminococcus sp. RTP21484sp1_RTP31023st1_H8_RTP31023_210422 TaxID=3141611 RepID=UPI0034A16F73
MYVTICGRFHSNSSAVARYGRRIRVKSTTKWGVLIADYPQKGRMPPHPAAFSLHLFTLQFISPGYIPAPSMSLRKEQHHLQHLLQCCGKVR